MNVFCHTVVRNEQARYWRAWLDWTTGIFDSVHVYDDASTDDTFDMAVKAHCHTTLREGGVTFLGHEGMFRQQAWRAFELRCKPQDGDWVFCIDSDEFLLSQRDERGWLYDQCSLANLQGLGSLVVSIPEVFDVEQTDETGELELVNPAVRIDGYWGDIKGPRLFRYQDGGIFAKKQMGSGSEPTYVAAARSGVLTEMWLMHYGYARKEDQVAKYARYSHRQGHSDKHVESIMTEPTLVPWDGPKLNVRVGGK